MLLVLKRWLFLTIIFINSRHSYLTNDNEIDMRFEIEHLYEQQTIDSKQQIRSLSSGEKRRR